VEATVKKLAQEDDHGKSFDLLNYEIARLRSEISKKISIFIWWMFFFAVLNVYSTSFIFWLALRK
jgi:hypothetical protein